MGLTGIMALLPTHVVALLPVVYARAYFSSQTEGLLLLFWAADLFFIGGHECAVHVR